MLSSIRARIIFSHLTIVMLVMFVVGPTSYYLFKHHLLQERSANLRFIARHAASITDNKLTYLETQLEQIVLSRSVQDFPDTARVATLGEYFSRFSKDFPVLGYLDVNGQEMLKVVTGDRASTLSSFQDDALFEHARVHPNWIQSGTIALNETLGTPALPLLYGIQRYFGAEFVGAVFAAVPLSALTTPLRQVEVGRTGFSCLVEYSGRVLSCPDQSLMLTYLSDASRETEVIKNALDGLTGVAPGVLFGVRGLVAYAPVDKLNATVLVIFPDEELLAAPAQVRNTILAILTVIFIFGCFGATFLANRLSRPIHQLTKASRRISQGDFSGYIVSRANGEIGELVTTFNQMVKELRNSTVSRHYFDRITSYMQEGLLLVGLDGEIRNANRSACKIIGSKESDIVGRSLDDFFNLSHTTADGWLQMLLAEPGVSRSRKLLRTKSAGDLPVSFVWSVLEDADGTVREFACLFLPEVADQPFAKA